MKSYLMFFAIFTVPFIFTITACGGKDCTTEAVPSVVVSIWESEGVETHTTVDRLYYVDDQSRAVDCRQGGAMGAVKDTWLCGEEITDLTIHVQQGDNEFSQAFHLKADACHVHPVYIEITLDDQKMVEAPMPTDRYQ